MTKAEKILTLTKPLLSVLMLNCKLQVKAEPALHCTSTHTHTLKLCKHYRDAFRDRETQLSFT